jgi:hypothetical protein
VAKTGKGAAAKRAPAPQKKRKDSSSAGEQTAKDQSPWSTMAKVLTAVIPLAGAGFAAVYTLLIQPCEKNLAECRAEVKATEALRKQLAASKEDLRKLPEVISYLEGLEAERARIDQDIDLLSDRLQMTMAVAATSRQLCARSEPGSAVCNKAAQDEAVVKELPARIDLKRKRSESLAQQIQQAVAKWGS